MNLPDFLFALLALHLPFLEGSAGLFADIPRKFASSS
jgi:hypothetical protein